MPKQKQKTKSEKEILRSYYRNTFSSPEGKAVLQDMLHRLNYYEIVEDEKGKHLSNFAKELLYLCGGVKVTLAERIEQ